MAAVTPLDVLKRSCRKPRANVAGGGIMRVVESTGHANACPKLLDSMGSVEAIIDKNSPKYKNDTMLLKVHRHVTSHDLVAVMRPC